MRYRGSLLIILTLVLTLAGMAHAAEVNLGPLSVTDDQQLVCAAANVSNQSKAMKVQVLDTTGNDITIGGGCAAIVAIYGGLPAQWSCAVGGDGAGLLRCRFKVPGAGEDFTYTACIFDINENTCRSAISRQ